MRNSRPSLDLVLGSGAHGATVKISSVGGDLVIKTGAGDDTATVSGNTVMGQTTIARGGGND